MFKKLCLNALYGFLSILTLGILLVGKGIVCGNRRTVWGWVYIYTMANATPPVLALPPIHYHTYVSGPAAAESLLYKTQHTHYVNQIG